MSNNNFLHNKSDSLAVNNNIKVWVLYDDRAGNNSQSLGVVEYLNVDYEIINLEYNNKIKRPNFLLGRTISVLEEYNQHYLLKLVNTAIENDILPTAIIAAGRRSSIISRWIHKRFLKKKKHKILLCHIMNPNSSLDDFSVVAIPRHDTTKYFDDDKVIYIETSPHAINEKSLQEAKEQWGFFETDFKQPIISIFLGGESKNKPSFSFAEITILIKRLNAIATEIGGSIFISTSRRTNGSLLNLLKEYLTVPHYTYRFNPSAANPYKAMMAYSKYIVVTGDSISMCSEACSSNAEGVYIYANDSFVSEKAQSLHSSLYNNNMARPFEGVLEPFFRNNINSAKKIADKIRNHELFKKANESKLDE